MKQTCINGFKRITKKEAARRYAAGETVRICPVNVSPVNVWGFYADENSRDYTEVSTDGFNTTIARNRAFDTVVHAYSFYNCNAETGRYPAYYVRG